MSARKKVLFDNDKILLYYPLSRDWCSYNEYWCESHSGYKHIESLNDKAKTQPGSIYIVVDKTPSKPQTYILTGHRVPLHFDGTFLMMDDDLNHVNVKKFFAPHKELTERLKLKYDIKERIKYNVSFTKEEINLWSAHNSLSVLVKGIIDNKNHMDELIDYLGDDLNEYEEYSYHSSNQVRITPSGIELFVDNDEFRENIMGIDDEGSWFYDEAMGGHYNDYGDEVESEELDYMSCWINPPTIKKLSKVFKLFGIDKSEEECNDYDEAEINDFLIKNFPKEWESVSWDMLSEAGYGLAQQRRENTKDTITSESAFEFDQGNSQTSMEISYQQLLYLIYVHNLENLSGLLDEYNKVNELDDDLQDVWYDTYDYGDEAYEEIDNIFDKFMDVLLDESFAGGIGRRKHNSDYLETIIKGFQFKRRHYQNDYELYINDNSIILDDINMEEGTLKLTKTVNLKEPHPRKRKEFRIKFEDISDYVTSDEIFDESTKKYLTI